MKKSFGKILSILLVLTLIVSAVPVSVSAASSTHSSHPICGSSCTCTDKSHGNYTSWTAWDGTTKMYNGNYYLTKDVVLDSTMILDYGYQTVLCLNGYSITCEDPVFYIYSYRSLWITDCKGTGKIESTGNTAIRNNKYVSIWGGTVKGDFYGIEAFSGTTTYVCGGRVEGGYYGIDMFQDADVEISGGVLHGDVYAVDVRGISSSSKVGNFKISGGRITDGLNLPYVNFTMTGGYVDGEVWASWEALTSKVTGGTINGIYSADASQNEISGGNFNGTFLLENSVINGGKFRNIVQVDNATISAGDFSDCDYVGIYGTTWIYGGYFSEVIAGEDAVCSISGLPEIDTIQIAKPGNVSAQNIDQSGSYAGDQIKIRLGDDYSTYNWKNGDIVIKNVRSDAVAEKFVLEGEDSRWTYLERVGDNLVLRILPHGKWGDNVTWGFKDGVLTVSGNGPMQSTHSGNNYPWADYHNEITKIVVEPGITRVPDYAFEYCEKAETIILPETLTKLSVQAFNDCGSLNNLLIPSSLWLIYAMPNSFLRCESLTDMYYLGTAEEWNRISRGADISSANSRMTKHFLEYHETTATCTEPGIQSYYQFDDTSVYGGYYNEDKEIIAKPEVVPALGHRVITQVETEVEPVKFNDLEFSSFALKDGLYCSTNTESGSYATLSIFAVQPCTIKIELDRENDTNGMFWFYKNNDYVSYDYYYNQLTVDLEPDDQFSITYQRSKYATYNKEISIKLEYDKAKVTNDVCVLADSIEADCTNDVVCDYCQTVVKEAKGHRVIDEQVIQADPVTVENLSSKPFTNTNGTYYSTNTSHSSSSQLEITADYDCVLTLNYGVSSESGYDKLIIKHNNTQKDAISGAVSNKTMTLNLNAGDTVTVSYSKDGSVSNNQDRGWVTLVYDQITVTESTDVPVEELDLKCDETVECDYCNTVIAGSSGHISDEWIYDTLPSIYDTGIKHRVCDECGEIFDEDTVAEKIIPDINGDGKVNSMDALIILNMSVGNEVNISDEATLRTDVNGDGKVNSMDALIVLNIAVGKIKLED